MRRRTFSIIIFLVCLFPIAGCNMDSAERIAAIETTVTQLQEKSGQVDGVIDGLQRFMGESLVLLDEPNLPAAEVERIAAAIVEAQERLDDAQAVKVKVDAVLADWQAQLAAAGPIEGPGDELELLGKGVATVGAQLPPPYGTYAALAGGLIGTIGAALAGAKKAGKTQGQLVKVIGSVDSLLDSSMIADEKVPEAKKLLAKRQGTVTAAAVKAVKET